MFVHASSPGKLCLFPKWGLQRLRMFYDLGRRGLDVKGLCLLPQINDSHLWIRALTEGIIGEILIQRREWVIGLVAL